MNKEKIQKHSISTPNDCLSHGDATTSGGPWIRGGNEIMDTDTPETDEMHGKYSHDGALNGFVPAPFARGLERERDKAMRSCAQGCVALEPWREEIHRIRTELWGIITTMPDTDPVRIEIQARITSALWGLAQRKTQNSLALPQTERPTL